MHSTEILEVNLFAFAYRLFHEDLSSIYEAPYDINSSSVLGIVFITVNNCSYQAEIEYSLAQIPFNYSISHVQSITQSITVPMSILVQFYGSYDQDSR